MVRPAAAAKIVAVEGSGTGEVKVRLPVSDMLKIPTNLPGALVLGMRKRSRSPVMGDSMVELKAPKLMPGEPPTLEEEPPGMKSE